MAKKLPIFKGYTVDIRLRQFRKVGSGPKIEFIDFNSEEGDGMLAEYIKTLNLKKQKHKNILLEIMDFL